jgi:hypothetical protein
MNTLNDKLKNAATGELVEVPVDCKLIHSKEDNAFKLSKLVLDWWEIHQYDICLDGDNDEHNLYDEDPLFVKFARELIDGR